MPLSWTADMSVGSEGLDADHRALLDLVRRLDVSLRSREAFDVVASLLTVVTELTEAHVAREEDVMQQLGHPVDGEHAHAHAAFLAWSQRLRDDFIRLRDCGRVRAVMPIIHDWWRRHVLDQDMADRAVLLANATAVAAILGDRNLAEPILEGGGMVRFPAGAERVVGLKYAEWRA